jgi:hypothetical protein
MTIDHNKAKKVAETYAAASNSGSAKAVAEIQTGRRLGAASAVPV